MKTKILSLALVVLMLFSTLALTGCSYGFHRKNYDSEFEGILSIDSFADMSVSVDITSENQKFLDAYYGTDADMAKWLDEEIVSLLRSQTYKNDAGQTVAYLGALKSGAPVKNDDVLITYYINHNGYEYHNVGSAKMTILGEGALLGADFDAQLIEYFKTSSDRGVFDRKTEGKITDATIGEGYDSLYLNIKAIYTENNNSNEIAYGAYDKDIRVDLTKIDVDNRCAVAGYENIYSAELVDVVLGILDVMRTDGADEDSEADGLDFGMEYQYVKSCVVGKDAQDADIVRDVTFKVIPKSADKEEFKQVTVDFESSNSRVPALAGLQDITVNFVITEVREYSLDADMSAWISDASLTDFKGLLSAMSKGFASDKAFGTAEEKAALIAEYREYLKSSTYKTLEASIKSAAKSAMFDKIVQLTITNMGSDEDFYPRRALKQAYDEAINNSKAKYYSYYTEVNESFEAFLISQYKVSDYEEAKEAVEAECKLVVLEKMVIMQTARILGIDITRKEYKEQLNQLNEQYYDIWYFYKSYGYTDAKDVLEYVGGKEAVYLAMYYSRAMELLYNDTYTDIRDIPKNIVDSK